MIKSAKKYLYVFLLFSFLISFIIPGVSSAQELLQNKFEIVKARVTSIIDQEKKNVPGTDVESVYQTIRAEILEGEQKGKIVTIYNDFLELQVGEKFYVRHTTDVTYDTESYTVNDIDRLNVLFWFVILFVIVVLFFSGKQGFRSIISLVGSLFIIMYILVPSLLKGYPPMLTSIVIAVAILFLAIYITHGFNKQSTVAFTGTVLAVVLTGVLAYLGVTLAHLTGFASDEAVYLNLNTRGILDFSGLLLGGIMIGVLGVLDDIAITQVAVVSEFYKANPELSRKEVYKKAIRVGKEHVGALVNTLALAYTGASLPLLLLFSNSTSPAPIIINQEIFATEIIRTIVGSIGLILTVPITTLLAIYILKDYKGSHVHVHKHL